MSIRLKIIFAFLMFTATFSTAVHMIHQSYVIPQFNKLHMYEAKRNMNNFRDILFREMMHLDLICHDWAAWDDTYDFIIDRNQDYLDSVLLDTAFDTTNIDMIYFFNTAGDVVWGKNLDFDKSSDIDFGIDFSKYGKLLIHDKSDSKISGIAVIDGNILFISSRPIVKSDYTGEIRGTLVMGRILDDKYIADLRKIIGVPFKAWVYSDISATEELFCVRDKYEDNLYVDDSDPGFMRVYTLMKDINANESIIISADFPKEIVYMAVSIVKTLIAILLVISAILFLMLYFLIRGMVVQPVMSIINHVRKVKQKNDTSLMMEWNKKDEIGELSNELDQLFNQLDIANLVNKEITTQINEKNELLHKLNVTDVMTNLFNKRHLSEIAKIEFMRARRHNHPLSIAIIDLDNFKKINDYFGHPIGDKVLKRVAQLMQKATRESDIVARFGGEEFVVLAPVTDSNGIRDLAERLRCIIENNSNIEIEKDVFVSATASFGVATYFGNNYQNIDHLFRDADDALLKAKREGRNRVCVSTNSAVILDLN